MSTRLSRYALILIALAPLPLVMGTGCEQFTNLGENYPVECPGQCIALPPLGFDGPALLWVGPTSEVPECPARAPELIFEGVAGLAEAPLACPACECSQPTCALPAGVTAYPQAMCQGSPADFVASTPWDGACTSPAGLPSNQFQSMELAPPTEQPCAPIVDLPQKEQPGPANTTAARACLGEVYPDRCSDLGDTCLPSAEPPPPGFRQCVLSLYDYEADMDCPDSYPDKVELFAGLEDSRSCTECTCTKTESATCVANLSVYQDTACSAAGLIVSATIPGCLDLMGAQLGSIKASWMTSVPGACQASGGESIGKVTGLQPRVFCCQGGFEGVP